MGYTEPGVIMTAASAAEELRNKKLFSNAYKDIQNQYLRNNSLIEQNFNLSRNLSGLNYGTERFNLGRDFNQESQNLNSQLLANESAIMDANIGSGYRDKLQSDFRIAAANAYDSYISNYLNNSKTLNSQLQNDISSAYSNRVTQLEKSYQELQSQTESVNKILETDAQNYANLYNAPREYLNYLVENNIITASTPGFEKYFDVLYVDGEPQYTLKSQETLDSMFYDYDGEKPTGLSLEGMDFYNQMFYGTGELSDSFNAWLAGTNKDLYDWAFSENAYGEGNNFFNVFKEIGLGDIIKSENYSGDKGTWNTKVSNDRAAGDLGTIKQYGNDVAKFGSDGIKILGQNKEQIISGKSEIFRLKTKSGDNEIQVKIDKDDVVGDDVMNAITNAEGKIGDNEIHHYNGEFYLSLIDGDGKTIFKKLNVTSKKEKEVLLDAIKNPDAHQNAYDVSQIRKAEKSKKTEEAARDHSAKWYNPLDWFTPNAMSNFTGGEYGKYVSEQQAAYEAERKARWAEEEAARKKRLEDTMTRHKEQYGR